MNICGGQQVRDDLYFDVFDSMASHCLIDIRASMWWSIHLSGLTFLFITGLLWAGPSQANVDVALSVSSNPTMVVVNRNALIVAEVFNLGNEVATDVMLSAILPAETVLVEVSTTLGVCSGTSVVVCTLGNLPSGTLAKLATISMQVTLNQVGSFNQPFSLTTTAIDTELINNERTATLEVVSLADSSDMSSSFRLMTDSVLQNVLFQTPVDVLNSGPQVASDVVVEFTALGLTLADFDSAIPSQGTCHSILNTCIGLACITALQSVFKVQCDLGSLTSSGLASLTVHFYPSSEVGAKILLTVDTYARDRADPDMNNNQANQLLEILALPDIEAPIGTVTGCFIATAAYGSDMHEDVVLLRQFRDEKLLKRQWGQKLVALYYRFSPVLADIIREQPEYRRVVRLLLKPIVWGVKQPLTMMILILLMIGIIAFNQFNAIYQGPKIKETQ